MDKPENLISLINLATVRSLEAQWGYEIDPLRFRANIYVDGFGPWREFDWIGANLRIGGVAFRVDRRNGPPRRDQRQSRHRPPRSLTSPARSRRVRP